MQSDSRFGFVYSAVGTRACPGRLFLVSGVGGGMFKNKIHWLQGGLIVIGLALSVASMIEACSDACMEAHKYLFFGYRMAAIGIAFFVALLAVFLLSRKFQFLGWVYWGMLSAACGAELVFMAIQKIDIGSWCPLCVAVAATVFSLAALSGWNGLSGGVWTMKGWSVKMFGRVAVGVCLVVSAFLLGGGVAIGGVAKPRVTQDLLSLSLGQKNSPVEVIFVTDWFCPACRQAEAGIVKAAEEVMAMSKVSFIDLPVHQETLNFAPYHLSFIVYEKANYLKLREALAAVSRTSKNPSVEQISAMAARVGARYRPLDFTQSLGGIQLWQKTVQDLGVRMTPTVVVRNVKTGKKVLLEGGENVQPGKIVAAVHGLK